MFSSKFDKILHTIYVGLGVGMINPIPIHDFEDQVNILYIRKNISFIRSSKIDNNLTLWINIYVSVFYNVFYKHQYASTCTTNSAQTKHVENAHPNA